VASEPPANLDGGHEWRIEPGTRQPVEAEERTIRRSLDHPRLPEGHRLRRHVLYRLRRSDWERTRQG
jgi:hypothetical protein